MGFTESSNGLDIADWQVTPPTKPDIHGLKPPIDLPRIIRALELIESHEYKTWVNIGLALKNENPNLFNVWKWWSQRSPKSNECNLQSEWEKLNPDGRITLGTIFHLGKRDIAPKYETYTLDHLLNGDFDVDYLIPGILVAGQPCLCVGPQKSLKTTLLLYMALCLSMGIPFLDRECKKSRVLFMSGESGLATLQETIRRMLAVLGEHNGCFHLSPNLPRFNEPLDELEKLLTQLKIEVLFIDPAYLCLDGVDAGNMFQMGKQLAEVSNLCTRLGVTLVLAHHCTKSAGRENKPLELADMAWAGFGEFARQWLLLSRRKYYVDGTGEHKLFLRAGGSAGHSNLLHLDISEGVAPKRHWKISAKTNAESISEMHEEQYHVDVEKVRRVLAEGPQYKTKLRDATGIKSSRWECNFQQMVMEGIIVATKEGRSIKCQLGDTE